MDTKIEMFFFILATFFIGITCFLLFQGCASRAKQIETDRADWIKISGTINRDINYVKPS